MEPHYQNHVQHYQTDAQYFDYFNLNPFMEDEISRRYQEILYHLKPQKQQKILEIGSGGGQILRWLNSEKLLYVPLDLALLNLQKIRQTYSQPFWPVTGDVFALPFKNNSFDFIILSEVLEHLDQPHQALKECYRILKPEGRLLISVPYKEVIPYYICIHCNKPTPKNGHLHSFDLNKLTQWVQECGFTPLAHSKFLNKVFNRLHLSLFLRRVPFPLWKIIDHLFNWLIDKPTSLILICQK